MGDMATAALGDLIAEAKPGFACGEEDENGVFQLRMNNVMRDGSLDLAKKRRVPGSHKAIISTQLKPGDVLFNATNSPDMVGKTALIPASEETMVFSNHFLRLRPKSELLDAGYLARWLQQQFSIGTFRNMCRQWVNQATVGREDLLKLAVPILSLAEQRRVVRILDQAEELRTARERTTGALAELERALFMEMFTVADRQWPSLSVGELAASDKGAIRTGPFGSQLLHEEFVDSGVAVLGIDNVVNNRFSWGGRRFITEEKYSQLRRYSVSPGDVLITIMGTCGRCAVVPDDIPTAINTKHLCCITLNQQKCLPQFLHAYFLQHPVALSYLRRTAKGAIMSGLNMEIIKNLPVALPPLRLQEDFVLKLQAIHKVRATQHDHLDHLLTLFDSLRDRAFRGEL